MKKFLLLILLAILPLQASWGVVGIYCQQVEQVCVGIDCDNDKEESSIPAIERQESVTQAPKVMDQSDHSCNGQTATTLTSSAQHLVPPSTSDLALRSHEAQLSLPILAERPERPQWLSLI